MAINFPGPYGVEIGYTVNGLQHKMNLNCDVTNSPNNGDAFSTINVAQNNGVDTQLDGAVDLLLGLIDGFFHTSDTFDYADLYIYTASSFERTLVSSYTPSITAGASANSTEEASQAIYTFRTLEGGIARLVLMEPNFRDNSQLSYNALGASHQALADYVTGTTGWIIGRDTSRIWSFIRRSSGGNEKTFRQRYR